MVIIITNFTIISFNIIVERLIMEVLLFFLEGLGGGIFKNVYKFN